MFAIIITILVLEIGVPSDLFEQSLREALDEIGSTFWVWVISFLITGMYWAWHRDLFVKIRLVDRGVVWLNLLFMLPAALIPFAASVLGEYHDVPLALHLYGSVLIAVSLTRVLLYLYVSGDPALSWETIDDRSRRFTMLLTGSPIVIYVLAMLVADAAPALSLGLYFASPILYVLLIIVLRGNRGTKKEAEDFT